MSGPRVSFIIPHRNHGEFLGKCLESSLEAANCEVEIVLIDDGSDDGSLEIAESLAGADKRIRLLKQAKRRGVESTLNRGLKEARGDYVVFRAADDRSASGFLDEAIEWLDKYPEVGYCLGDIRFFTDDESRFRVERMGVSEEAVLVDGSNWNEQFGGEGLTLAAALVRRSVAQDMGGMDEGLFWLSDWAFMVEAAFRFGMVYLPRHSCSMMLRGASYNSVGSGDEDRNSLALRRMLERLSECPEVRRSVEKARVLGFFRNGLSRLEMDTLDDLSAGARGLYESAFAEVPQARSQCGMPRALREFLKENQVVLQSGHRVAIYGAGGHTQLLLEEWRLLGLPSPQSVLTSGRPGSDDLEGVPIREAKKYQNEGYEVIVVSSKSYESDIAEAARALFPKAQVLTIWG